MPRERRKAPRQLAPQTIEEATKLVATYVALLDEIEAKRTTAQTYLDQIAAVRDEAVAPLDAELKAIFKQLRPWWAASKDELTEGRKKSIELAGAQLGERTTTPALALPRGMKADDFTAWLLEANMDDLVRTKHSADKPACIRALRSLLAPEPGDDDHEAWADRINGKELAEKGVAITQRDEFFIDRAGKKGEQPELVDVSDEREAA